MKKELEVAHQRPETRSKRPDSATIMKGGLAMPPGHHMGATRGDGAEFWKARVSDNPITDAFDEGIVTHLGMGSVPVPLDQAGALLDELSRKERSGRAVAYFNIPYCETRCLYCMFYINPYRDAEESHRFSEALIREMQLWDGRAVQSGRPFEALYFGGGTPTALSAEDIERC